MRLSTASLSALAASALLLAGCGDSGDQDTSAGSSQKKSADGTITVFAAASLQGSFSRLGKRFEEQHPSTEVEFNFGPSSGLAQQIGQGAPADVFASASTTTMDEVIDGGDASKPTDFASNTMQIAVPPDNPAGVDGVDDLAKKDVKVALCQADVPCGATALEVFENAGIKVTPVTEELDVKATLSKVSLGEVDAGVVYVTDVEAAGDDVSGIEIPADVNASTTYPIASLSGSENTTTANEFISYVLSPAGEKELTVAGFSKP